MLGGTEACLCVEHCGARRIEVALRGNGGNWYVEARTCGTGLRVGERCLRLFHRDLVVLRIDGHEHITSVDKLSFDDRNFEHVSVDSSAQGHDVAVYLCVVRRLPRQTISHEEAPADDHQGK